MKINHSYTYCKIFKEIKISNSEIDHSFLCFLSFASRKAQRLFFKKRLPSSFQNLREIMTIQQCQEASMDAIHNSAITSWVFEDVLQTIIGIIGLLANTIAIPILCSKEMGSVFNRLLVLLAIHDNVYILCRYVKYFHNFFFFVCYVIWKKKKCLLYIFALVRKVSKFT